MSPQHPLRQTEYVTLPDTTPTGQPLQVRLPVSKTDYVALLAAPTALPVRNTVVLPRAFTHDELLEATGPLNWNWLDEPADGLIFTAFHPRGQLPQVVIRYFDATHILLIAGTDATHVQTVQQQARQLA